MYHRIMMKETKGNPTKDCDHLVFLCKSYMQLSLSLSLSLSIHYIYIYIYIYLCVCVCVCVCECAYHVN